MEKTGHYERWKCANGTCNVLPKWDVKPVVDWRSCPPLPLYPSSKKFFVAATFSAEQGWWNERLRSDNLLTATSALVGEAHLEWAAKWQTTAPGESQSLNLSTLMLLDVES